MGSVRTMLEGLTRDWLYQRRLPPKFHSAPLYVSPGAGLKFLFKPMDETDPLLLSLAEEFVKPGAVVWDIGANIGLFSTAAASMAGPTGQVVALEPDTKLVEMIRRSARLQSSKSAKIQILPAAVASSVGVRSFAVSSRSTAMSHLAEYGSPFAGRTSELMSVVCVTLDTLLESLPAPNVVKIDVERAEMEVLNGARRLLEQVRPTLLIEVGHTFAQDVADLLKGLGYQIYDATSLPRYPLTKAPWSTIAIPGPARG